MKQKSLYLFVIGNVNIWYLNYNILLHNTNDLLNTWTKTLSTNKHWLNKNETFEHYVIFLNIQGVTKRTDKKNWCTT